jgi:hypothetical protein
MGKLMIWGCFLYSSTPSPHLLFHNLLGCGFTAFKLGDKMMIKIYEYMVLAV